jgi:prophage regulatory protein
MQTQEQQYVRVADIVGDRKASPPKPAILPVSASCWWNWVKTGRAPQPIRLGRTSVWRKADVLAMIEAAAQ